jgi:hypothetical protein
VTFTEDLRARLARIADALIPGTDEMPAPSSLDIAFVTRLASADAAAHEAFVTAVVAGYYLHPEVQRRLGYPGQVGVVARVDTYPDYVHEGQLERVLDRGPIYRPTPQI